MQEHREPGQPPMELGGAQVWGGGSASPGVWPGIKQGAASSSSLHGNSTEHCCPLPSHRGDPRGLRDKGQPGSHALHIPVRVWGLMEQREIPAKTLILIF